MGRKPVVSLEDRVPQLKQRRRKKANRRLLSVVLLFILVILIILYFQSPYSKFQSFSVEGATWLTDDEIMDASGVSLGDSYWATDLDLVEENLLSKPEVKSVEASKDFPTTLQINIQEFGQIAYIKQEKQYIPILENGATSKSIESSGLSQDAPILVGFSMDQTLEEMAASLSELPPEVRQSISEILLTPTNTDKNHISVYMNDGFEVSAVLDTFALKMAHYPAIVSQLDPSVKGVIDLEVGSYFRAYQSGDQQELDTDGLEDGDGGEEDLETEG
ncbi:cell division protein FtsQ/DivIB [Jeotgalibacillus proteolyticus]|uniref:Cell division protein DivIB n=1 Tax=Jeotgalibacillus proteolyticus TaxID=2082395 RepID=A0A2S5GGU7_9BACL|nr:cell division protein FtsQ/DivIB [Jeotgalibacillus proteolyticus]PPA72135.1 cell division protein FtsQ [Jeotgalibacillus proteolyticus]